MSNKLVEEIRQSIQTTEEDNIVEKIRNKNHDDYYKLDIQFVKKIQSRYETQCAPIIQLYENIDPARLLTENKVKMLESSKKIQDIYEKIASLKKIAAKDLSELISSNDYAESLLNMDNLQENTKNKRVLKKRIIEKYNNLKLFTNSTDGRNVCFELERQTKRKDYIDEIKQLLIDYEDELSDEERKQLQQELIAEIEQHKTNYYNTIDQIEEVNKKAKKDDSYKALVKEVKDLFDYDKKSYRELKEILEKIKQSQDLYQRLLNYKNIINHQQNKKEDQEYLEKSVLKSNLLSVIKSINNNYLDILSPREKKVIAEIQDQIAADDAEKFNIYSYKNKIKSALDKIWDQTIMDIKDYNDNEPFAFICSLGNFNDNPIKAFLLTDQTVHELDPDAYGYICTGYDNIITITEKQQYNKDEVPKQKTPKQIESETVDYKIHSNIYLSPDKTNVIGMFYLVSDNHENSKKRKAQALAKKNELPLIKIKVENKD